MRFKTADFVPKNKFKFISIKYDIFQPRAFQLCIKRQFLYLNISRGSKTSRGWFLLNLIFNFTATIQRSHIRKEISIVQ